MIYLKIINSLFIGYSGDWEEKDYNQYFRSYVYDGNLLVSTVENSAIQIDIV